MTAAITAILAAIAWISSHWADIGLAVTGLVTAASIVVRITPTQRDDRWLAKAMKVLERLSLAKPTPAVVRPDITQRELEDLVDRVNDASAQTDYRRPLSPREELDALTERL